LVSHVAPRIYDSHKTECFGCRKSVGVIIATGAALDGVFLLVSAPAAAHMSTLPSMAEGLPCACTEPPSSKSDWTHLCSVLRGEKILAIAFIATVEREDK
jgi:hypothetical protein